MKEIIIRSDDFVNLRIQSEYSFPEGACRIEALIAHVKALGQKAAAVTDIENMYAAILFYQEARKQGIKPLIGCEFRGIGIFLCQNLTGYQNLIRLVSEKNMGHEITPELLRTCHEGLILILTQAHPEYDILFQKENLFADASLFLPGIAPVAVHPVKYVQKSDMHMQRVLTCIRTGKTLDELPEQPNYQLLSAQDALTQFSWDAVQNTCRIADRCCLEIPFHEQHLPVFFKSGLTDHQAYFKTLCQNGMYERYGNHPADSIQKRLAYEMQVISDMGFIDYFLIVHDFVRYAKMQDIPVGCGRGSAAGSLCAYCLDITEIDPIAENLLFERFLNPGRQSMPDIDIDFCIEGRGKVIDYVTRKYGKDHVAEIIAFDTLKAKAAVRDTGRVLNLPTDLISRTAKLCGQYSLTEAAEQLPDAKILLETAAQIEGMPRHTSIHAAGIVITDQPVMQYVPVQRNDSMLVTQYTMTTLEELGLLKMDFLGLRNLTVLHEAEKAVRKKEAHFSLKRINLNDKDVFQMISEGKTLGIFQLEKEGMRNFLMRLHPSCMADITAALALYRPGPMESIPIYLENRKHPEKISYLHPELVPILEKTYGCMLYQEQVMEICRKLAGYSYSQADLIRRAMAKKKPEIMKQERQHFFSHAIEKGIPGKIADQIFDQMEQFAGYAFNQSHAAAYARIAYQTAYLKYHYFGEYMAALMTSLISDAEKLASCLDECRKAGLFIIPPDINYSDWKFKFQEGKILCGLLMIRGLGRGLIDKIIAERKKQLFTGFADFCRRASSLGMARNQKLLEMMIKSGALDHLDYNRRQMLTYADVILNENTEYGVTDGQMSLFGEIPSGNGIQIPDLPDFSESEKTDLEKEALGLFLRPADHDYLKKLLHCHEIAELETMPDHAHVRMICVLQNIRKYQTKNNENMAFLTLEDASGKLDGVMFPECYRKSEKRLIKNQMIYLIGNISRKNQKLSLICEAIRQKQEFPAILKKMQLCIKIDQLPDLSQLKILCQKFPGETELIFYQTEQKKYILPKEKLYLAISEESYQALCNFIPAEQIGCIPRISGT